MNRIKHMAELSIGRGVGFGGLAIGTSTLGLIFDPEIAFKTGATLTLMMTGILFVKALNAVKRPYRETETWLLLDKEHGLPEHRAQEVIGAILKEIYLRYTRWSLGAGILLWALSLFS